MSIFTAFRFHLFASYVKSELSFKTLTSPKSYETLLPLFRLVVALLIITLTFAVAVINAIWHTGSSKSKFDN